MSRTLVLFASHHGQTRRIAGRIAEILRARGAHVHVRDIADERPDPAHFDAVVVGAPVELGRHDARVGAWLREHRDVLSRRPGAFFSVSLSVASTRPGARTQLEAQVSSFLDENGFHPALVARFAGALRYRSYNPILRLVMRLISRSEGQPTDTSRDHELTDWGQVEGFAHDVLALLPASEPVLAAAH